MQATQPFGIEFQNLSWPSSFYEYSLPVLKPGKGPSIKYVTLFWPILTPPSPLSHFVTHPRTPPKVGHTSRTPPIFSRPSTKILDKSPLYKFYLNCSRRFLSWGFSGLVFVHSPFCHNTSVTTES